MTWFLGISAVFAGSIFVMALRRYLASRESEADSGYADGWWSGEPFSQGKERRRR